MFRRFILSSHINIGLLILRLVAGILMIANHGLGKMESFDKRFSEGKFDPIGIGSEASTVLIVGAEFVCALLIILGLWTRLAAIPLVIAMLVAAFVAHGDDPLGEGEMAVLFASIFLTLFFTGPGRYSLDAQLYKRA